MKSSSVMKSSSNSSATSTGFLSVKKSSNSTSKAPSNPRGKLSSSANLVGGPRRSSIGRDKNLVVPDRHSVGRPAKLFSSFTMSSSSNLISSSSSSIGNL